MPEVWPAIRSRHKYRTIRPLFDSDCDFLGKDRRIEGIVSGVTQHQLKRVLAGRQFEMSLSLTRREMYMILVRRDRFVHIERLSDINQQMMMAAIRKIVARVRHPHVAQTKSAPERALDGRTVLWPDEI